MVTLPQLPEIDQLMAEVATKLHVRRVYAAEYLPWEARNPRCYRNQYLIQVLGECVEVDSPLGATPLRSARWAGVRGSASRSAGSATGTEGGHEARRARAAATPSRDRGAVDGVAFAEEEGAAVSGQTEVGNAAAEAPAAMKINAAPIFGAIVVANELRNPHKFNREAAVSGAPSAPT